MLTLFRKIRKSLVDSTSAKKYLLYATGEIALVVIGILIALQINNWNEWRKDRVKETEILNALGLDLERNEEILKRYISFKDSSNYAAETILHSLENKLPYSKSLDIHFERSRYQYAEDFVSESGYEQLRNEGFDIIKSQSLREEIIELFEATYSLMREEMEVYRPNDINIHKYIDEHFSEETPGFLSPVNYEELLEDNYYKAILKRLAGTRWWQIEVYNKSLSNTQRVLQLINEELQSSD